MPFEKLIIFFLFLTQISFVSAQDSCWAYSIDAIDKPWTGNYTRDIAGATSTTNGYLICGTANQAIFTSRIGTSPARTTFGGFYVANYSKDGLLKWTAYSKENDYSSASQFPVINSVCTDKLGNIYIVGWGYANSYFYTPDGDSSQISTIVPLTSCGFIAKLDSTGALMWKAALTSTTPLKIKIDNNGNVGVIGKFIGSNSFYKKGSSSTSIHTLAASNYFILKLDSNGVFKWVSPIDLAHNNPVDCSDFDFDNAGNFYLTGGYEYTSIFYSSDQLVQVKITNSSNQGGSKFFLVKYNNLGIPQWAAHDVSTSIGSKGYSIVSDSLGDSYVTGSYQRSSTTFPMTIKSADGSTQSLDLGGYFTLKFNPAGALLWGVGNKYSYYGYGEAITFRNNEVSIVGIIRNNSGSTCNSTLTSTNAININLTIGVGDLFIADYDTNGVLKNVEITGINTNLPAVDEQKFIFRDDESNYYVAGDFFSQPVEYFGDVIIPNGIYDGFVAKMDKGGCGMNMSTNVAEKTQGKDKIVMYPNPVNYNLNIYLKSQQAFGINIYNMLGEKLYAQSRIVTDHLIINKKDFAVESGIYLVEILMGNERILNKIIISD